MWSEECTLAFDRAKEALTQATLLVYPRQNAPLSLMTGASDKAVGAALQQLVIDEWQPISYFSHKLSSTECCYSRELLATHLALKHFLYFV